MLYAYSITPLADDEFEARARNIIAEVKRGTFLMPLFSMTLTPEGVPVWDKVGKMAKLYAKYRDYLSSEGVESGILVQASLGHGYPITRNPFQPVIGLKGGTESYVCCPEDDNFLKHFCNVLRTLAKEAPRAIMLDDDFRLLMRPELGCACPLHMAKFNERAGVNFTREELFSHIMSHGKRDRLARIFAEVQRDSLIKAATAFRSAIDEIDPTIQGINCTSGDICEAVTYTNKIFAGKGNPTIVRIPNGIYAPESVREFSALMRQTAVCKTKLKRSGIDIILSETDTIPFNRYAKSSRYLHSHYTASMLDGLKGAKHWLTRMSAFEPKSGIAYRDILAKHLGMYEKLSELADEIKWVGCNSAFVEQEDFDFCSKEIWHLHDNYFATKFFERIGVPFFFSDERAEANFLEGDIVNDLSDEKIEEFFHGSVFLDAYAAKALYERGFGEKLGVRVDEWDLGTVSGESFDGTLFKCSTKQKNLKKLTVENERVEVLSHNYLRADGYAKLLAPAVTLLERENGRLTVVFSGTPNANFNYMEGFAFLNETRKAQLIALLRRAGALPVYLDGDDEVCLRAGYLSDGTLLAALFELGIDPIDSPRIFLEKKPERISLMLPNGDLAPVEFSEDESGIYSLNIRIEPLYPSILMIK